MGHSQLSQKHLPRLMADGPIRLAIPVGGRYDGCCNFPPLIQNNLDLNSFILDKSIHFYIVPIVAERIFKLGADSINTVESEDDKTNDGNGPPAHFIDHGEGEDASEERKDLLLVNSVSC